MELLNSKLTNYLVTIALFALVQWQASNATKKDAVRIAEIDYAVEKLNIELAYQRSIDDSLRAEITTKDSLINILDYQLDSLSKEQKKIRNANWKAFKEINELRDIAGSRPNF